MAQSAASMPLVCMPETLLSPPLQQTHAQHCCDTQQLHWYCLDCSKCTVYHSVTSSCHSTALLSKAAPAASCFSIRRRCCRCRCCCCCRRCCCCCLTAGQPGLQTPCRHVCAGPSELPDTQQHSTCNNHTCVVAAMYMAAGHTSSSTHMAHLLGTVIRIRSRKCWHHIPLISRSYVGRHCNYQLLPSGVLMQRQSCMRVYSMLLGTCFWMPGCACTAGWSPPSTALLNPAASPA